MVDRIFKIILLFTPIAYCVGVDYYRFELIFFQIASMLLITSSLFDTPKREFKIKKLTALFFGLCLFSVIVNGFKIRNLSALINIFLGCIDIYILTVYSENLRKCLNWLLIGLGINTLIFIGQLLGYSPFIDPKTFTGGGGQIIKPEWGGIIGNSPRFATFIALILPFIKRFYIIPALILGFFLGESSIFVSIFAILFYELNSRDMKKTILFMSCIALGILALKHKYILQAFSIRIKVWKMIMDNLAQCPLYGFGLGFFNLADYGFSFMQWIYGVGVLGIGFIVLCIKRMKWYLTPLLFLCLVEYPFEIPRLYPVLIFVIAFYAIDQKEEKLC